MEHAAKLVEQAATLSAPKYVPLASRKRLAVPLASSAKAQIGVKFVAPFSPRGVTALLQIGANGLVVPASGVGSSDTLWRRAMSMSMDFLPISCRQSAGRSMIASRLAE